MQGQRLQRKASLVVIVVPILISGSFASYSNGRSRYQQVYGCNETGSKEIEASTEGGSGGYQPVVLGPQDFAVGDRMTINNAPSGSVIDMSDNRYKLPAYGNSFDEEEKPKAPYSQSILGASRFAQFQQSALTLRNQIAGNRFFEPDSTAIRFTLFNRKNSHNGFKLEANNRDLLENSGFSPEKPTKLIIHGFSEIGALGEWVGHIRDAYLSTSDANVIIADFSTFETFLLFWTNLPIFASRKIADLITFLELAKGANRETFHLIARSYGTHVAGVTGRLLNGKLGRITGLEPEPRVFGTAMPDYRLMHTDAQFVDVVHVNGRRYFFLGARFGLVAPQGHVDVYPNYSEKSNGCPVGTVTNYGRNNFAFCQRGRGVSYFTDSIKYPQRHPMCQCRSFIDYKNGNCFCNKDNSDQYLGEHLNNQTRGVFQLKESFQNRNFYRGLRLFG